MNCKNCQTAITGSFCHVCGQRVLKRFSFSSVFEWLSEEVSVFDKGFLFTLKELILRPAKVSSDYINGCTMRYYNPFKLLIIVTTIPFFFLSLTPDFNTFPSNLELLKEAPIAFTKDFFNYFQLNWPFFIAINFLGYFLMTIPFWSLFSWFFFRKLKFTYIEHLIYISFLASSTIAILFCLSPLIFAIDTAFNLNSDLTIIFLVIPYLILMGLNFVRSSKSFYKESYFAVIVKGFFAAYIGLFISFGLQFLTLSVWRIFL